ncbi:hypothetical protein [Azospirillum doebereinerae]|uniref:NodB homology domain-containing protein n=1 Tax=Azospirillum doebereinerae TaxID=92933 RepID=A0A433J9X2_9PROT|nr:hypothetical protein [Azospirillum doebereinerae]MCG5238785.1 hypothetical protein [Azospirillum doebereinerae]RUQ72097.1 hypothetical protein EJ913_11070 [Azospirillum doebereinerae]
MSKPQGYPPCATMLRALDRTAFGEETFRGILSNALDRGYRFARFDDPDFLSEQGDSPVLYIRHDVDISPNMAFRLGKIENEWNISSNFFFQFDAETYSFFGSDTLTIVRALRNMGHCVGLHIDERLLGSDKHAIRRTFDWVNEHIVTIDPVVSFHRPTPAVLGRRYEGFLSTYDDRVFDIKCYLSDSRRSLAFHETLTEWIKDGRPRIQLLLHPEWWCEVSCMDEFWDLLSSRRADQLRRYMLDNFPKVFSGIVNHENGTHKI